MLSGSMIIVYTLFSQLVLVRSATALGCNDSHTQQKHGIRRNATTAVVNRASFSGSISSSAEGSKYEGSCVRRVSILALCSSASSLLSFFLFI